MSENFFVVSVEEHERIVCAAYSKRGFTASEAEQAAKLATAATRHGIRTHNAIKAIHLDDLFGSAVGGCVPGAEIERLETRFDATEVWDAKKNLGRQWHGKRLIAVSNLQRRMVPEQYQLTIHSIICGVAGM